MSAFDRAWDLLKNDEDHYVDDEFIISPVGEGDWKDAFGAFMQDRMNPGCDEAKRIFISMIPEGRMKQAITNDVMNITCDEFLQRLEAIIGEQGWPEPLVNAASTAYEMLNRMGGMDEGMA